VLYEYIMVWSTTYIRISLFYCVVIIHRSIRHNNAWN